jgi:hypothetical protein
VQIVRFVLLAVMFGALLWFLLRSGSDERAILASPSMATEEARRGRDSEPADTSRERRAAARDRLDRMLNHKAARF